MRLLAGLFVCAVCLAVALAVPARAAEQVDVSGEWLITIQTPDGSFTPTVVLKQDGEKLTGTYKGRFGESKLEGTLKENAIKWEVTIRAQDNDVKLAYSGTVESGDTMKGSVDFAGMGSAEWTAKRKAKEK